MMVLHRDTGVLEHRHIADIVDYITAKDLLVVNDTKVFPARLLGKWADSPGAVEVLMIAASPESETTKELVWNCMLGSGRKCREGQEAVFGPKNELRVKLLKALSGIGMWKVQFICERPLMELLDEFGHTPVPPYVKREGTREEELEDRERYQTIYAKHVGSVAAPTAGLHFTPEIFAALEAKGVKRVAVTLHVGPGTFRPVKAENIEDHQMDFEAFSVGKRRPRRFVRARRGEGVYFVWARPRCVRSRRWPRVRVKVPRMMTSSSWRARARPTSLFIHRMNSRFAIVC